MAFLAQSPSNPACNTDHLQTAHLGFLHGGTPPSTFGQLGKSPMLHLNTRVILRSFNGTSAPPGDCTPGENYWQLIDESGTVIEAMNSRNRVLVKFDNPVVARGLTCHNPVPDSLYILATDLEVLE